MLPGETQLQALKSLTWNFREFDFLIASQVLLCNLVGNNEGRNYINKMSLPGNDVFLHLSFVDFYICYHRVKTFIL